MLLKLLQRQIWACCYDSTQEHITLRSLAHSCYVCRRHLSLTDVPSCLLQFASAALCNKAPAAGIHKEAEMIFFHSSHRIYELLLLLLLINAQHQYWAKAAAICGLVGFKLLQAKILAVNSPDELLFANSVVSHLSVAPWMTRASFLLRSLQPAVYVHLLHSFYLTTNRKAALDHVNSDTCVSMSMCVSPLDGWPAC